MKSIRLIASLAAIAAVTACAPRSEPPPAPEPAPPLRQAPPPRPSPPPPPAPGWEDAQLTPGGWALRGVEAVFGASGGEALFTVRCDQAARRVTLTRQGSGNGPLVVRTSTTARTLPTTAPVLSAALSAYDPSLDAMVFSRGRFSVEAAGQPRLVIPAWPEPARVIEDCRG